MRYRDDKRRRRTRKQATKRLRKIENALMDAQLVSAKNAFIEKFTCCEILYKSMLADFKKEKGSCVDEKNLKIDMKELPSVIRYAGLSIDKNKVLDPLFSSSGQYIKRNKKSAKQLRNAIVHKLSVEDMEEVRDRKSDLLELMNSFIEEVRNNK